MTLMELLWKRMTEMYGHRWTSAMGAVPVDGWVIAVEGFSPEQIRGGLTKMVKDPQFKSWPPNALEFRALCLPSEADLGLPTADEAFAQAVGNRPGQQKHPAVIHALRQIDSYALRLADEATARKIWAEAWSSTVGQVAGGKVKSVRETSLVENLTDRSWAGKNNHKPLDNTAK